MNICSLKPVHVKLRPILFAIATHAGKQTNINIFLRGVINLKSGEAHRFEII